MARLPPRERVDELLYDTLRAIYHFERSLYERFDLGYQDLCLLQLLRRRPRLRVGEAARSLELPLFSATRLAQRLEGRGLLRRSPDPRDGRAVFLELLPAGEALLDEVEEGNYALIAANARKLSDRELESLVRAGACMDRVLGVEARSDEAG